MNNNFLSQLPIVKVKIIKNSQRLSSTYQLGFSLHRFNLIQIIKPFYCNKQDYLQIPQFLLQKEALEQRFSLKKEVFEHVSRENDY
ncbi:unnamed protein product [Paramecium pentaurelia]|uniref:Uncharacterized protein n=1 Tax=Paramecium pentaurelia TaxID=43138 RepID=A0A8S1W9Z6_9CILI|nr:unnamed protein product [Paramecium pentaurelia]